MGMVKASEGTFLTGVDRGLPLWLHVGVIVGVSFVSFV